MLIKNTQEQYHLTKCIGNTFVFFVDIDIFIYFDGNFFQDNGTTRVIANRNVKWVNAYASTWAWDAQICVNYTNATIQKTTKRMTTKLYLTMKHIMTTNRKAMIEKYRFLLICFNCTDNNETVEINILLLQ